MTPWRAPGPLLTRRRQPSAPLLQQLEEGAIGLYHRLRECAVEGPWDPAPIEERYRRVREALLLTPGVLRAFRHWYLAAGRLNFPDAPRPKDTYLRWEGGIPWRQKWPGGALRLWRMYRRLSALEPVTAADLQDTLIGQPSTFMIPRTPGALARLVWRRLSGVSASNGLDCYRITEAQLRFVYYRKRITRLLNGQPLGMVLEVGGGYGGLAAELLQHVPIGRYVIVELPDAMPLAALYLRACFEEPVQALAGPDEAPDPEARILILPPWALPHLPGEADLLINTMSFQHMTAESLQFYFAQAQRLRTGHMYLVNRDVQRDPTDVPISRYPIPDEYRLLERRPYPFEPHVEAWFRWAGRFAEEDRQPVWGRAEGRCAKGSA